MLPAEVSRKLGRVLACATCGQKTDSAAFEGFEDLLTSNVFGVLRYLDPKHGLEPVLRDLNVDPLTRVSVEFWHQDDGCEPDVVIDTGAKVIVVEAKLHATFGPDQLPREVIYADRRAAGRPWLLLCVTDHRTAPGHHLFTSERLIMAGSAVPLGEGVASYFVQQNETSVDAAGIASRIAWMSWSTIAGRLQAVRDAGGLPPHVYALLDDLVRTLEARGLTRRPFRGFMNLPAMSGRWCSDPVWRTTVAASPTVPRLTWSIPPVTRAWSPWFKPGTAFRGFGRSPHHEVPAYAGWFTL